MGQVVPSQNPAVVLRSHFNQLRALLAVALIAVIGLTVAVVVVANDENQPSTASSAAPAGQINYGGFSPATGRPYSVPLAQQEHPLQSRVGTTQQGTPAPKDYSMNSATGDH
jgi:hypothetical protein